MAASNMSERDRSCLEHLRQAEELGVGFTRYWRERDLPMNQLYWIKRRLRREGVIEDRPAKPVRGPAGFAPVRTVPATGVELACRISHPSRWVIECASVTQAQ